MVRVSVVIPCLDGPEAAIKDLERQTFRDFEVLVQSEKGIAKARNEGTKRASGEYIAVQDSDDKSHPGRLEREVAFLSSHLDFVAVGSWANYDGRVLERPREVKRRHFLDMINAPVLHSTAMIRTNDLQTVGGYRQDVIFEDADLWIRLSKVGRIANLQEVLADIGPMKHTKTLPLRTILYGLLQVKVEALK